MYIHTADAMVDYEVHTVRRHATAVVLLLYNLEETTIDSVHVDAGVRQISFVRDEAQQGTEKGMLTLIRDACPDRCASRQAHFDAARVLYHVKNGTAVVKSAATTSK